MYDSTSEQREQLFASMMGMKSTQVHGPLTKLMRWYSWFESHQFHSGELYFTKLLMLHEGPFEAGYDDVEGGANVFAPETEGMSPQQELRFLKMKFGTWALAPSLINKENMFQKTLIFECGRALWTRYSHRAKTVKTVEDVAGDMVQMVFGGWKQELVEICNQCMFNVEAFKKIYMDPDNITQDHLEMHSRFAVSLLSERAISLVAQCCRPPFRYAGLCQAEHFTATRDRMQHEWEVVLLAEQLVALGHEIPPLTQAHCLKTAFVRLHFLANEMDIRRQKTHDVANGALMAQIACRNLGDTVLVENVHQKTKDLLMAARHNQIGKANKFQAVINSGVFKGRDIPHIQVPDELKAHASLGKKGQDSLTKITAACHPGTHKMTKKFQNVMRYKASAPNFDWPSSSHLSLHIKEIQMLFVFQPTVFWVWLCYIPFPSHLLLFTPTSL